VAELHKYMYNLLRSCLLCQMTSARVTYYPWKRRQLSAGSTQPQARLNNYAIIINYSEVQFFDMTEFDLEYSWIKCF